jgi:hypothetical protein
MKYPAKPLIGQSKMKLSHSISLLFLSNAAIPDVLAAPTASCSLPPAAVDIESTNSTLGKRDNYSGVSSA